MNFENLVRMNRSYRRFYEEEKISFEMVVTLIGYARLSASSANIQGLKFFLSVEEETNEIIFKQLKWASYLRNWKGPEKGERPSAYIIVLGDTDL
ncbi:MAG: nitroreductase, partial [Bacteroidales bacterium]|nr:nitroreductase [Bacteroidales bacterium]